MHSIPIPSYLFPVFFLVFWIFILFLLSRSGWSSLALKYKTKGKFIGNNIGWVFATVNNASYAGGFILKYNSDGLYMKGGLLLFFHPPIFIPWKDIAKIKDEKLLFINSKKIYIGNPCIAKLGFSNSTLTIIENAYNKFQNNAIKEKDNYKYD